MPEKILIVYGKFRFRDTSLEDEPILGCPSHFVDEVLKSLDYLINYCGIRKHIIYNHLEMIRKASLCIGKIFYSKNAIPHFYNNKFSSTLHLLL